jgi:hypothetical protein
VNAEGCKGTFPEIFKNFYRFYVRRVPQSPLEVAMIIDTLRKLMMLSLVTFILSGLWMYAVWRSQLGSSAPFLEADTNQLDRAIHAAVPGEDPTALLSDQAIPVHETPSRSMRFFPS